MDKKILDYIDELLKKAEEEGFDESEVYYESESSMAVSAREGKIVEFENSDTSALSFRGLYNGQMGYSCTEDIQPDMIPFLLSQAKDNCCVLEVKEKITVYEGEKEYPKLNNYNEELEKIDYVFLSDLTLRLEQKLLAYDRRIEAVEDCIASCGSGELYIKNSKGMVCHDKDNGFDVYLGCRAKEGEDVQTYGKGWLFKKLPELDEDSCVNEVGKRVISKLGSTTIPSVKASIVLDRKAAKSLLSSFSGSFSAELMQKGLSRLSDKLGEKIADEKITLIDEGIIDGSYMSQGFDSEGVLAKRTILIDKGVFTSPLHNRKTALVDGVETTGNAYRSGVKGSLGIAPMNFHFENGTLSKEELFEKMGEGVYITALFGLHAGINSISGDFSLMAEGFTIKDGKVDKPVNQITIADNFFDMLMKVEALGNDIDYFSPDSSHIQSPSLLIPDVSVAGE